MTEYRTKGPIEWTTQEWHNDRARAPHLEQPQHAGRIIRCSEIAKELADERGCMTLLDMCAGDGGFLSLVTPYYPDAYGYDWMPTNIEGAKERGVNVVFKNVMDLDLSQIVVDVVVLMECLEHFDNPHDFLQRLSKGNIKYVLASSPHNENDTNFSEGHVWAWDTQGYVDLFENNGWKPLKVEIFQAFQIVVASK